MAKCEYCSLVVGDAGGKHVITTYKPDGCVKQEFSAEHGAEPLIQELSRAGWEYAFRDLDGTNTQIFFKRPLKNGNHG